MNLRTWSAIGVILLLISCSQSTQGIFASIEREQKIKSNGGLSPVATVTHMIEYKGPGPVATTISNYYIAGGGTLFHRVTTETKWHSMTISDGATYSRFMAVGLAGTISSGTLYTIANRDATDSNRLFKSTDGGVTWIVDTTLPSGVTPQDLIPIHKTDGYSSDALLLTVTDNTAGANSGSYDQVFIITSVGMGSSISMASDLPGPTNAYSIPFTGAAVSSNATDYYFVNNNGLYWYNGASIARVPGGATDLDGNGFYGIALLPPNKLNNFTDTANEQAVLSSSKGVLYWGTLSGGTWFNQGSHAGIKDTYYSQTVPLGAIIYEDQTTPPYLWIGTRNLVTNQGAGFASLSLDEAVAIQPPSGTNADNYNSTTNTTTSTGLSSTVTSLSTAQVLLLFRAYDGTYFAGTAAQGLWNWNPATISWSQQ